MKKFLSLILLSLAAFAQTSVPQAKPQPNTQTYGIEQLALFNVYNRDSYFKVLGVQATPFHTAKPVKYWFDTSVTGAAATYTVLDVNNPQQPTFKTISLTADDARTVNLPGVYNYPSYVVAPTQCETAFPPGPIDPITLSTKAQADALNAEIQGEGAFELSAAVCPPNEARRQFVIRKNGLDLNAGLLLSRKNSFGVGAPGVWDFSGLEPAWNKTIPDTGSTATNVLRTPVRRLLPNEKFAPTMFNVQIARTDMQGPANNTGSFSDADRALLKKIADKLGVQ